MQKKVNGKAAPRQQFLFPDNSTFCQAAERFQPFGYPANRRLSHTFYSCTAPPPPFIFFFFLSFLYQLPTTGQREASNFPTRQRGRRIMKFFLWGVVVSLL